MYNADVYKWWKKKKEELYKDVFSLIDHLNESQSYRRDENVRHMRLYGDSEVFNLRNYNAYTAEPNYSTQNRVTLNIIKSMVDTVVSKVTKNRPKPTFLTEGGDFSLQRKAKKLTQFLQGQFACAKMYEKAAVAFLDSCIFGTGALKIYREESEIKVERVFIDEIKIDEAEGIYGEPLQMHQTKFVHRETLLAMFPDCAGAINNVDKDASEYGINERGDQSDMLVVVESWKLPSKKNAKDGKHSITIANETLFEEPYEKTYFPFVFFRWGLRPLGFWGQGVAEQLTGIQLEINKILRTIQVSMHLVSIPKLLVEANSKVVSSHLNNKIGGIIKYIGTPPTPMALGSIPADLFSHLDRLVQRAYEVVGVSALSASAQKPAGLDSGKALREYNDLETERFMSVALRYEQTFMDAAKIMIDLGRDIYAEDPSYSVKSQQSTFIKTIKWKEVDIEEDKYLLQVFPTSFLSSTPAGKMQDVQDLMQMGFLEKNDAMKLLDMPDLREYYNFNNSGVEDIERQIERIIEDGKYETPEPYQNLEMGKQKMQQAYLRFRSENAPENKLEMFRRWIEDAANLQKKAAFEAQLEQARAQQAAEAEAMEAQQIAEEGAAVEEESASLEEQQMIDEEVAEEEDAAEMEAQMGEEGLTQDPNEAAGNVPEEGLEGAEAEGAETELQ